MGPSWLGWDWLALAELQVGVGEVDKFNMQSGQHRGTCGPAEQKHSGAIRGLSTDAYNQVCVKLLC